MKNKRSNCYHSYYSLWKGSLLSAKSYIIILKITLISVLKYIFHTILILSWGVHYIDKQILLCFCPSVVWPLEGAVLPTDFWFDTDFVDADCFPGSKKWLHEVMKKTPTTVVKIMTPYLSQPVLMTKVFRSWEFIPSENVFLSNSQMSDVGPVSTLVWFGRSFWQTLHLGKKIRLKLNKCILNQSLQYINLFD